MALDVERLTSSDSAPVVKLTARFQRASCSGVPDKVVP
jgi:hypothetical protein